MNHSSLYQTHLAAGATLRPQAEVAPLLTYGQVPEEYEAAKSGAVLFDRTDRGTVRVRGSDAVDFLHRLVANDIKELEPSAGNRNLLLSSKGKILFDFDLSFSGDEFLLSCAPGQAANLLQALDMYLFAEDVTLEDVTEEHAPLFLSGPAADGLVTQLGAPLPQQPHSFLEFDFEGQSVRITRLAPLGTDGYALDGGPGLAEALWQSLLGAGASPAGRVLADILRVEACRAQALDDIDDNIYPQEARLEEAFSLSKGCYIGQEVVAKIDTYGGVNKLLCALSVSHSDPIARGARLHRWSEEKNQWRDLGMVTSWAYSFEHDTGQILAYVKRRHQEPGTVFRVEEGPAEATLLP